MMLSVLLVMAVPVRAGSIQFGEVVQTIVDGQNGRSRMHLRLRNISQSGRLPVVGGTSSNSGGSSEGSQQGGGSNVPSGGGDVDSSTVMVDAAPAQGPSGQVQTVDLGDVTGTVCDCGEIPIPAIKRGFPLWPLLAGIPLICVTGICKDDEKTPICIVNCGETVIPEPATLLLFGSGLLALGARARRRRRPEDAVEETDAATTTTAQV